MIDLPVRAAPDRALILLVEDDQDVRRALVQVLQDEGYGVSQAANGVEALAHLRANRAAPPALILLDIMMPVMNGFEFRDEQVRDPGLASIPVVVLTADNNGHREASRMQIAGVIPKPVKLGQLLAMVEEHTAEHGSRK